MLPVDAEIIKKRTKDVIAKYGVNGYTRRYESFNQGTDQEFKCELFESAGAMVPTDGWFRGVCWWVSLTDYQAIDPKVWYPSPFEVIKNYLLTPYIGDHPYNSWYADELVKNIRAFPEDIPPRQIFSVKVQRLGKFNSNITFLARVHILGFHIRDVV